MPWSKTRRVDWIRNRIVDSIRSDVLHDNEARVMFDGRQSGYSCLWTLAVDNVCLQIRRLLRQQWLKR